MAIAAFYENNFQREKAGLQPLQSGYIPAIIMIGTAPIFYRIHVTMALLQALATSSYPQEETTVLKFIPPVPNLHTNGMRPLDNRHITLQCFRAFKAVIVCLLCPCLKVPPYLICSCRSEWCSSQSTSERETFLFIDFVSSNMLMGGMQGL